MATTLVDTLVRLVAEEVLVPVDRYFAQSLQRLVPEAEPAVLLAAALARRAIDYGHVCLDLTQPDSALAEVAFWPTGQAELRAMLAASSLVGDGVTPAPLVLADNRLYLYRYWRYETELAAAIAARIASAQPAVSGATTVEAVLDRLLAGSGIAASVAQRQALLMAASRHLAVISGGPGTGKTTIVAYLLALIQELAPRTGREFARIMLLAPTGKAAARLGQAMQERVATLPVSEAVRAALPREASTIHRALGYQSRTPTLFRHGHGNLLRADLVVVDEASMVDLALMAKLFAAVAPEARLVLLGDKDQLASVEAGSLMGDLCLAAEAESEMASPSPLARAVVQLDASFRFAPERGIGALVQQIKAGDSEAVLDLLDGRKPDAVLYPAPLSLAASEPLRQAIVDGYRAALAAAAPRKALERFNEFRVLCAHRRGPAGVRRLNDLCARVLAETGLLRPQGEWYQGRPLMITANSYSLKLFNGDLGVVWPDLADGALRAWFIDQATGHLRSLPVSKLPAHDTAFAMTVHKSQGSEFARVAVVLPPEPSPVLTRELLYTAVSRARQGVMIFGAPELLRQAVGQRVTRNSGLRTRLANKR